MIDPLGGPRGPHDPALTNEDLVARAQVDTGFVDRLVELGIIRPTAEGFSPGDVWRTRILRLVEGSGVTLQAVATAVTSQDFDLSFLDTLLPAPSPTADRTLGELAETLGDHGTVAGPMAETLGLDARPDVPLLEADDEMLTALLRQWGGDPDIALRAARLVAQTTQRFAEGWAGLHYELYRVSQGPDRLEWTPQEHARESAAARSAVSLALTVLPWAVLHHLERLLAADVVDNVLTSVGPFAARIQDPKAGARLPAVAFVDISGYTALTESAGDTAAAHATSRFEHAVTVATTASAGRIVKLLGDGALLLFPDADPCGSALRAVASIRDQLRASDLHPHAGIDSGPVVERDGDIFGKTVNRASRLAALASAGQVVVSETVANALDPGERLTSLGEVPLKGFARPVRAFMVDAPGSA